METISIIIPTILRPSVIHTAKICARLAQDPRIEIIVSVNPLDMGDKQARETLGRLLEIENIRVEIQRVSQPTAEASSFHSIVFARHSWVWFLGDDDYLDSAAVQQALKLIEGTADFWLINCLLRYPSGYESKYYEIGPKQDQICIGLEFFKKFGLISATTTISCILVRKEALDIEYFEKLHEIQGIYSHSFFLFSMLYNRQVGATDRMLIVRNEAFEEDIRHGLEKYTESLGIPFHYLFTRGLLSLVFAASSKTGIPVDVILNFRELEITKGQIRKNKKQHILARTLGDFMLATATAFSEVDSSLEGFKYELSNSNFSSSGDLVFESPVRVTLENS
jgi:hypothetical protein